MLTVDGLSRKMNTMATEKSEEDGSIGVDSKMENFNENKKVTRNRDVKETESIMVNARKTLCK